MKNSYRLLTVMLCLFSNCAFTQMLPREIQVPQDPMPPLLLQPTEIKINDHLIRTRENSLHDFENKGSGDFNSINGQQKRITQSDPSEFLKDIKPDPQLSLEPISFNSKEVNFERFRNSPCFSDLGFNPNRDPEEQERRYRDCEESMRKEKTKNSFQIGFGVLLVLGFCGAIFYFAIKSKSD